MTNISWNEIQDRAAEFAAKWSDHSTISSERGEAQSFWSGFLDIFGIDRRRHGAFFEYAIKKGSGSQGFIDMFWPGKLLAEQKAPGRDLSKATTQAYEYLETMPDHDLPEAIVMSDFANLVFIANDGSNEKVEFALAELPKHVKFSAFCSASPASASPKKTRSTAKPPKVWRACTTSSAPIITLATI